MVGKAGNKKRKLNNTSAAQQTVTEQKVQVEVECANLLQHLNSLAPHLQPQIIPRGFFVTEGTLNLFEAQCLQALCTKFQLQHSDDLDTQLSHEKWNRVNTCTTKGCLNVGSLKDKSLKIGLVWSIDFNKKMFCLRKAEFLCNSCFKISDLESFLEDVFLKLHNTKNKDTSTQELQLLEHFNRVNNVASNQKTVKSKPEHKKSDDSDSDSDSESDNDKVKNIEDESGNIARINTYTMQQAFSVAYALKQIASDIPIVDIVYGPQNTSLLGSKLQDVLDAILPKIAAPIEKKENKVKKAKKQHTEKKASKESSKQAVQPENKPAQNVSSKSEPKKRKADAISKSDDTTPKRAKTENSKKSNNANNNNNKNGNNSTATKNKDTNNTNSNKNAQKKAKKSKK